MKRLGWILTAAILTAAPILAAQLEPELTGPIAPELVLETSMKMPVLLTSLTAEQAAALPAPLAAGDKGFDGKVSFPLPAPMRVVLVEPKEGTPFLYADRDQDGKLTAEERFPLLDAAEPAAAAKGAKSAAVSLPLAKEPFKSYPLKFFRVPEDQVHLPLAMRAKADAVLLLASFIYIEGRVPVDGKEVLVRYSARLPLDVVDARNATVQMDVDGDGKIDPMPGSREVDTAQDGDAIFRIGDRYVSLSSIDLAAGKMTLQSHPPSEYLRLELTPGTTLPDFSFVDLEGKSHKLSDWRGRYVLLDFWATWCAPCITELPNVKKAHEEYHPRGFDVVGVLYQEQDGKAREFLKDPANQFPWLNATAESTREMAIKRLRIRSIPTTILIDPQGKVVSTSREGEPPLEGEELSATLAKLLPATTAKDAGKR